MKWMVWIFVGLSYAALANAVYLLIRSLIRQRRFDRLNDEWDEIHAEMIAYMDSGCPKNAMAAWRRLNACHEAQKKLMDIGEDPRGV